RYDLSDHYFDQYQGNYLINVANGNGISENRIQSYLTSLNYNYAHRYYLTANFRRDGLSALAEGNKWGNFGGVSGGWTISQEEFFKSSSIADVVTNLRLNASWGRVGNSNLPNAYGSFDIYSPSIYGSVSSMSFSQAGNKELGWETSEQTNFRLNLGLFNDRINLEASYYNKNHNNLILSVPQTPVKRIPGNSILINIGSMYNRGFEFALNIRAVQKEKFRWTTTLNVSTDKNQVTTLDNVGRPLSASTASLEV